MAPCPASRQQGEEGHLSSAVTAIYPPWAGRYLQNGVKPGLCLGAGSATFTLGALDRAQPLFGGRGVCGKELRLCPGT